MPGRRAASRLAASLLLGGCTSGETLPPEIAARIVEAPPPRMVRTDARFGGVALEGYLLEPYGLTHAPGSEVAVTFVWRVDDALEMGWAPFTHLVGGGRMLNNLDASGPLRESLPVSRWPEGRYLLDEVRFTMPAAASHVTLLTGFYRDSERHPVEGKAIEPSYRAAWVKLAVAGAEPEVPQVRAARREGEIALDGVVDEEAWGPATEAFVDPRDGLPKPERPLQARARLAWDDDHLYVAFTVADRDLRGGFARDARDPHLWTRDAIELMIDPEGDNDDYVEIQVGPQNLVFDSRFDHYGRPHGGPEGPFGHEDFASDVESAVTLDGTLDDDQPDRGYVVELRIPFSALPFAAPRPGDGWRMNLYAVGHDGAVAWSPIYGRGSFHFAPRFGRVVFE